MNEEPSNAPTGSPGQCPKCGAALPADAPLGLCPACLLAAAAAPPPTHFQTTSPNRPEPPPLDVLQTAFPQLEIIELIGQGGMGVVYKARQPKLDRFVALKILPETLGKDPSFEERFTREARTLARLSHPNIVTIYDHGHAGAFFYLMMEFVDGVNLRQAMAAGKFTPAEALALVPRICEALQYAHEEGVLHRDIKPENILLDAKGRVKIADFGIAKMLGDAVPGSTLTASGAAMGTPQYMAPEQIEHPADVDHRADIFSLGVVFYEMLTGELPLGRFGPPSSKSAVDRRVDEIVFRTLEKERELRQQTAGEVKKDVETVATSIGGGMKTPPMPPADEPLHWWNRINRLIDDTLSPKGSLFWKAVVWAALVWFGMMVLGLVAAVVMALGTVMPLGLLLVLTVAVVVIGEAFIRHHKLASGTESLTKREVTGLKVILVLILGGVLVSRMESVAGEAMRPLPFWNWMARLGLIGAAFAVWRYDRKRWPESRTRVASVLVPAMLLAFLIRPFEAENFLVRRAEPTQNLASANSVEPPTEAANSGTRAENMLPTPAPTGDTQGGDSVQEIELKVAKQQLEKDLTELGDATREYATARAHPILILGDGPQPKVSNKEELQEKIRFLVERRDAAERDIRNKTGAETEATDIFQDIRMRVGRDQFEKTLTDIADTEKQLAKLGDNSPARGGLLDRLQQLRSHSENLRREIEALSASANNSGSVKPGPVATIQPPDAPFRSLAHLTNALRIPFSLEPKRVGRFWLEGPQRVTVSAHSTWDGTSERHSFSPIEGQRTFNWNRFPVPPVNAFVPYAGALLEPEASPTDFSVTIVSPDSGMTDVELIWEPIPSEKSEAPFPKWRFWIVLNGAPTICSGPLAAPIGLSQRFAFPKYSLSHERLTPGPTRSFPVTPLDLSLDSAERPSSSLPSPSFDGPTFDEWYVRMTNALGQAIIEARTAYGVPTNQNFRSVAVTNWPVKLQLEAPPVVLESRWNYQLQQLWGAFTLTQSEFTNRFPVYRSITALNRVVPSRPEQAASEPMLIPDWIGIGFLKNAYQSAAARAEEKLTLKAAVAPRPQHTYFPNDRVRIGLMTDEAEILAAIRSGSTNQVFGAVAQP